MTKRNFLQTASLVTLFSVFERALGFLYRIILSRTIGSEGMGLYQLALSVYAVLLCALSSGVPITLSRLIAKHRAKSDMYAERQSVTAAILLTLLCSIPLFFLFYAFPTLSNLLFSDERCSKLFLILLYGLVFNCVYAVLRGSFWGNRRFLAYSLIELLEEGVMIVVGSLLVVGATDLYDGAKKAAFAVVVSYLTSFTVATVYFFIKGGKLANPVGQLRPLLTSAVPITAMRTSSSLVNSLLSTLLPLRLAASGLSTAEAMAEYGVAMGMAIPVLYTPATVIGSVALVLTPELAENYYRKDEKKLLSNIQKGLKVTCLVACATIPFLFVFGQDLGTVVFSSARCGKLISYSCAMLLPMSVNMITSSMLNSMGQEKKTLLYYFSGALAMLAAVWFLTPIVGVYSVMIGQVADHTVCALLNLHLLKKKCPSPLNMLPFTLTSCLFTVLGCAGGKVIYSLLQTVCAEGIGVVLTTAVLVLLQGLLYLRLGLFRPILVYFARKNAKKLPKPVDIYRKYVYNRSNKNRTLPMEVNSYEK